MEPLCSFIKRIFEFRRIITDNWIFRLHYKFTFPLLLGLSFVVAWRQHFGSAINCRSGDLSSNFISEYCYIHSTYSLKEAFDKKVGEEVPYPGFYPGLIKQPQMYTKIYHTYYQWVSLILFIQAVLFVVPKCFWKYMESGRIRDLVRGLSKLDADKEDLRQDKLRSFARRLHSELSRNWVYFACYALAEVLNVVNVIGQFYLLNAFLGGKFSTYGPQMLQFSDKGMISKDDPSIQLFPRVSQCDFYQYGSSGHVQKHVSMCLLPINALNAKIYAFLWFWFVLLAIVSCISCVCTIVFCLSPAFRQASLMFGTRLVQREDLRAVLLKSNAADCFLIRILSQNLSSADFRDVMGHLANGSESGKRFLED